MKVLFFGASHTVTTTSTSLSTTAKLSFSAYNTLGNIVQSFASAASGAEQDKVRATSAAHLKGVGSLVDQVSTEMARLGLQEGQMQPLGRCTALCASGLVVELTLAPFARLNEYVELTSSTV